MMGPAPNTCRQPRSSGRHDSVMQVLASPPLALSEGRTLAAIAGGSMRRRSRESRAQRTLVRYLPVSSLVRIDRADSTICAISGLNYAAHVGTLVDVSIWQSACLKNSALVCASVVKNSRLL